LLDADERSAARREVERLAQTSLEPALDATEVEQALDAARVAQVWEAGKAYSYGDKVVPGSPRGRYYKCVEPGTSGSSEPAFPAYDGGRVSDGSCVWEEAGYFSRLYDVRRGVYEALSVKLSKASEFTGTDESRIVEHLERQRRRYAPVGIA
jgi:hypothetical protein